MHTCRRTFILAPLPGMLLPPGPYGEPRAGGAAYLWPCGPPPWDICLLPTTCASGFPGGCSPAAGEWPGRTRRGTRSLQEQEAGAKAPLQPACLPLGPARCPATSLPRTLLPAPWELSCSVPALETHCSPAGAVHKFTSLADSSSACTPRPTYGT